MAKVTVIVQKDGEEVARFDGVEWVPLSPAEPTRQQRGRLAQEWIPSPRRTTANSRLLDAYPKSQTTAIRGV